jgi:hypothetical protein
MRTTVMEGPSVILAQLELRRAACPSGEIT